MKKFLSVVGLTTILGLGVYSIKNSKVSLPSSKEGKQKTFIVNVEGNLKGSKDALAQNRNRVLSELSYLLPSDSFEVTYTYDTILNGFAVKTDGANEELLKQINGVISVSQSHTYAAPETVKTFSGAKAPSDKNKLILGNYSAETMGATAEDVKKALNTTSKGGEGITIGIIDTGLFSNQIDGNASRTSVASTLSNNGNTISAAAFKNLDSSVTKTLTKEKISAASLGHNFVSINDKIVYAYDYVGRDTDVDPTAKGSEHGTHVASLATANGDDFKGVAPNAQLAVMKVFGDNGGGAGDDAITAALNDAAKMNLDIVNLSLGTDLMDHDDNLSDAGYKAVRAAHDKGVIVNFSAGNNGKSSYSGIYTNYAPGTTEPGTLGSYANYDESANIVASSNPDKAYYQSIMLVKKNGATSSTAVSFNDQVINRKGSSIKVDNEHFLTDLLEKQSTKTFDYVYVRGFGLDTDFEATVQRNGLTNLEGKIAVVNRGDLSFTNKVKNAISQRAKAVIIVNNVSGTSFNFSFDWGGYSPTIPVVLVFQSVGSAFGSAKEMTMGTLSLSKDEVVQAPDGNMVSSFSSDGPGYNLDIDPTLSAPGGSVIGAVSAAVPGIPYQTGSTTVAGTTSGVSGYDNFSGTSMASPNLSGAMALALGEFKALETYSKFKSTLSNVAMASADQLVDASADKEVASVRMQGAGRINARKMLKSKSYLTFHNPEADATDWNNASMSKAELKNTGSLFVDGGDFTSAQETYIEIPYTIHNDSSVERTYKSSLSLMIPELSVIRTKKEYNAEAAESKKDEFVKGLDKPTQGVNEDEVSIPADRQPSETITVPAGQSVSRSIKVRIDDLPFSKKWRSDGSTESLDFQGTLKQYFAKYFSDNGGSFVEGYLKLEDASVSKDSDLTMTMPYLGFYGDYTKGNAVEDFDFEKRPDRIYNSEITDNYVKNLNSESKAVRPRAESGSYISSTSGKVDTQTLQNIADLKASVRYGSSADFHSVAQKQTDGSYRFYAGADGISDSIVATFFVERSVSEATWEIKKGSTKVRSGNLNMIGFFGGNFQSVPVPQFGLSRSWFTQDSSGERFDIYRGFAEVDLKNLKEGDYSLSFSFTKRANGSKQVKSYPLTIDKTAPSVSALSRSKVTEDGETYELLKVDGIGAQTMTDNRSQTITMEKKEGTEDIYTGELTISDEALNKDIMSFTITDYAHNEANVLVKPSDPSTFVVFTKFTEKSNEKPSGFNFDFTQTSNKPGKYSYSLEITDAKGNPVNVTRDYKFYCYLPKGLSKDDISISAGDSADTVYTYDPVTGLVCINMPKDVSDITFNHKVGLGQQNGDGKDSSSSAPSSTAPAPDNTKKKGCGGTIAVTSTLVGAAALTGVALFLKKRKEEK